MDFDSLDPELQEYFDECFDKNLIEYNKIKRLLQTAGQTSDRHYKHHIIPRSFFKMKNLPPINTGNLLEVSAFEHVLIHTYYKRCAKGKVFQKKMDIAFWKTFYSYKDQLTKQQQKTLLKLYDKRRTTVRKNTQQCSCFKTSSIPYEQRICFYSGTYFFVFQLQAFLPKKEIDKYILKDPPKKLVRSIEKNFRREKLKQRRV